MKSVVSIATRFGQCLRCLCAGLATVALLSLAGTADVAAKTGPWADAEHSSVRLISAVDGVGDAGALRLGLEFHLQPGWKIYWRSPG